MPGVNLKVGDLVKLQGEVGKIFKIFKSFCGVVTNSSPARRWRMAVTVRLLPEEADALHASVKKSLNEQWAEQVLTGSDYQHKKIARQRVDREAMCKMAPGDVVVSHGIYWLVMSCKDIRMIAWRMSEPNKVRYVYASEATRIGGASTRTQVIAAVKVLEAATGHAQPQLAALQKTYSTTMGDRKFFDQTMARASELHMELRARLLPSDDVVIPAAAPTPPAVTRKRPREEDEASDSDSDDETLAQMVARREAAATVTKTAAIAAASLREKCQNVEELMNLMQSGLTKTMQDKHITLMKEAMLKWTDEQITASRADVASTETEKDLRNLICSIYTTCKSA